MRVVWGVILVVALLGGRDAFAQTLPAELRDSSVTLMGRWSVSGQAEPMLVAVTSRNDRSTLVLFRRTQQGWAETASVVVGDVPLNAFTSSEADGYLVTEWGTGSGFVVRVFEWSSSDRTIRQVLTDGAKGLPDVIRSPTGDFDLALIFRTDEQGVAARGGPNDKAVIYQLKRGNKSKKSLTPWPKRYSELERLAGVSQ
jgi:hypothetical protein